MSRMTSLRESLTGREWRRMAYLYGVVALLHIVGWGTLLMLVAPRYPKALGIGVGVTAYLLGLRHAFDADHISAIDNTTRKLLADGRQPLGTGFFFSLGHSTVVLGLCLGLAFAANAVAGQVAEGTTLKSLGGYIGTGVSSLFLYMIAALNMVILVGIVRVFREMRRGEHDEARLERHLQERGLMNRFLGPLARSIRSSWQMYPLGILFGLGFDTATEVALLALAAGAASTGLPFYAIVCLPVIFAAGMSLMDTADGAFMAKAYGWAFSKPVRKVYYNITVTGLSVAVAFIVGTFELLSIVGQWLGLTGPIWHVDLNLIGYLIVAVFLLTWAGAWAIWHFARIEERWRMPGGRDAAGRRVA